MRTVNYHCDNNITLELYTVDGYLIILAIDESNHIPETICANFNVESLSEFIKDLQDMETQLKNI